MIRVLAIDDEVPLLRNLSGYLNSFKEEFQVVTATTGEQGLELLAEREFDVLLTDVRLPGIDGIDLLPLALKKRPGLRVIVMTAFGSSEVRNLALSHGALRFLEKPIDLNTLRDVLASAAEHARGFSGLVGGLDLFDLTQLMMMTQRTRGLRVTLDQQEGILVFRQGNLVHATCDALTGVEAFYEMTCWWGGRFTEMDARQAEVLEANIELPTAHLLMEAARLSDEKKRRLEESANGKPAAPAPMPGAASGHDDTKEGSKMKIKEHLEKFNGIEGFLGVGVFSPQGEMMESHSNGSLDLKAVGLYANNTLLNSQKATDQMGVGRGNLIQIEAPKATVIMRCLNEATDFAATKAGKSHFHTMLVMNPDGNTAMAKMVLEGVVENLAEELR